MYLSRRLRAAVLAVPVLLAGCATDTVDGSGVAAGGASSSDRSGATTGGSGSVPSPTASSTSAAPIARYAELTGAVTSIALDARFLQALTTLKVIPAVVGSTRLSGGAVEFPISGGDAAVYPAGTQPPVTATVQHAGGGLSLTAGGTSVELSALVVELGTTSSASASVAVNGKPVVSAAKVFDLDTSSAVTVRNAAAARVEGVPVRLGADLAKLLNQAFGIEAFTASVAVGTATLSFVGR